MNLEEELIALTELLEEIKVKEKDNIFSRADIEHVESYIQSFAEQQAAVDMTKFMIKERETVLSKYTRQLTYARHKVLWDYFFNLKIQLEQKLAEEERKLKQTAEQFISLSKE